MLTCHRKTQIDVIPGGVFRPLVVIAWAKPGEYSRLFCIWKGGVWIRLWGGKRWSFVIDRTIRHLTHKIWNREISRLLCRAYERRVIDSKQLHELTAMFLPGRGEVR